MTDFLLALIGAALVSNLILGLPLAADALRHARAQALGPAAALLILFVAPGAWLLQQLLQAVDLAYLHLLLCVPLLAALGGLVLTLLARWRPGLAQPQLWPLLLGNGLGAAVLARSLESFSAALALGIGGGLGFLAGAPDLAIDPLHLRAQATEVGTAQQVSFSLPYVLYLLSEICIL